MQFLLHGYISKKSTFSRPCRGGRRGFFYFCEESGDVEKAPGFIKEHMTCIKASFQVLSRFERELIPCNFCYNDTYL